MRLLYLQAKHWAMADYSMWPVLRVMAQDVGLAAYSDLMRTKWNDSPGGNMHEKMDYFGAGDLMC